jgi:predicted PurR-regulated permease PerM
MMMLFIFSILLYGSQLKRFLFDLSPLPEEDEQLLIDRFNQMNYVTLVMNGLGGVLQGVLAGGAMWLAGFSSVLLWTVMMVVLAFIPLIGISFVYIPATIYLIAVGEYVAAVLFFVWCSAIAFLTENWLKPMWVGNRIKISSMAVLFFIIGGMAVFGTAGIFYGPLVLTLFLTFVDLYHARYVPRLGEEGGE